MPIIGTAIYYTTIYTTAYNDDTPYSAYIPRIRGQEMPRIRVGVVELSRRRRPLHLSRFSPSLICWRTECVTIGDFVTWHLPGFQRAQ